METAAATMAWLASAKLIRTTITLAMAELVAAAMASAKTSTMVSTTATASMERVCARALLSRTRHSRVQKVGSTLHWMRRDVNGAHGEQQFCVLVRAPVMPIAPQALRMLQRQNQGLNTKQLHNARPNSRYAPSGHNRAPQTCHWRKPQSSLCPPYLQCNRSQKAT